MQKATQQSAYSHMFKTLFPRHLKVLDYCVTGTLFGIVLLSLR